MAWLGANRSRASSQKMVSQILGALPTLGKVACQQPTGELLRNPLMIIDSSSKRLNLFLKVILTAMWFKIVNSSKCGR